MCFYAESFVNQCGIAMVVAASPLKVFLQDAHDHCAFRSGVLRLGAQEPARHFAHTHAASFSARESPPVFHQSLDAVRSNLSVFAQSAWAAPRNGDFRMSRCAMLCSKSPPAIRKVYR